MDIQKLLQPDLQHYILRHEAVDEKSLLLKNKTTSGVSTSLIADQISGRRKARIKLPSWYKTKNIIYPPSINLEQCSSETTAHYKTEITQRFFSEYHAVNSSNRAVDLTGGFGVDSFFLSSVFSNVDYTEPDENLFEIVKHNHSILQESGIQNPESRIRHYNTTAEKFLASTKDKFDLIYIDPSRRLKGNQKIVRLANCAPDIIELLDIIFDKTEILLLKASPMLDLQQGIKELRNVTRVFVLAVDNECKEVLFLCRKGYTSEPVIEAVDLRSSLHKSAFPFFEFQASEEKSSVAEFSSPLHYLYEPHAAILKAGAFKLIAQRFAVKKLQLHTHLYTSENLVQHFPGKIFEIEAMIKPNPKVVKHYFPEAKANVVSRNYPLSPEQLKKKTGLKDGGQKFLIGFSGVKEKFVAVCNKVLL
ncbi:MAG: class I SAM-dependent methyltransferase [Bacteroidota bacterium]